MNVEIRVFGLFMRVCGKWYLGALNVKFVTLLLISCSTVVCFYGTNSQIQIVGSCFNGSLITTCAL